MSGDRLAQIEAKIAHEHLYGRFPTVVMLTSDAEALVEIAKAARDTRDYFQTVMAEEGSPVFAVYERLDDALARLDSEATT